MKSRYPQFLGLIPSSLQPNCSAHRCGVNTKLCCASYGKKTDELVTATTTFKVHCSVKLLFLREIETDTYASIYNY